MTHLPKIVRIAAFKYGQELRHSCPRRYAYIYCIYSFPLFLGIIPLGRFARSYKFPRRRMWNTHAYRNLFEPANLPDRNIVSAHIFTNFKNVELPMATCIHFMFKNWIRHSVLDDIQIPGLLTIDATTSCRDKWDQIVD